MFGRINECTVTVEVQDKISPNISCPDNVTVDCDTPIDLMNLDIYGTATASDVCGVTVSSIFDEDTNDCGIGQITRTFSATDANTASTCEQVIFLRSLTSSASPGIVWPLNYETDMGCDSGTLDPDLLPEGFDYPDVTGAPCTDFLITFKDQSFVFSGNPDGCRKILRTWTVTDGCMEDVVGYMPETYEQSIKISDNVKPTITSSCGDLSLESSNCVSRNVNLVYRATDTCTDDQDIQSQLVIQIDGVVGVATNPTATGDNKIQWTGDLPVGDHVVVVSFEDQCGNIESSLCSISIIKPVVFRFCCKVQKITKDLR